MKRFIVINILLTLSLLAQQQVFTLEESIKTGLENSKNIKISQSELTSSKASVRETASNLLPKLSLSASYTRLSDVKPFEVTVPFSPTPITIQETLLNQYNLKLSLQQPLFTGFRLTSLKSAAEYNTEAEKLEHHREINEEAFRIQEAFWNYYKAEQVLKLVEDNVRRLEKHLADTKNFLNNGLATKNDLLRLEVRHSNAKLNLIDAKNNVNILRTAFNKAIGIPLNSETTLKADAPSPASALYNYDEILPEAMNSRDDLKAMRQRINAGEEQIDAVQSGWMPKVYAFGNFYYANPNPRIMPQEDEFNDTWDVGVALNWDLWDWGNTSAKTVQAEQAVIKTETSLAIMKEAVELEVYQNYLRLNAASDKVEVARLALQSAEENLRITGDKYDVQLSSSSDLIDAEVDLLNAQTELTNTLVDYEVARVRLEKSIGRRIY